MSARVLAGRGWSFLAAFLLLGPPAAAQNRLTNGTFDTGIAGWSTLTPPVLALSWSALDAHGSPESGSLRAVSSTAADFPIPGVRQCVPATAGERAHLRASFFYPSGQAFSGVATVHLGYYSSVDCSGIALAAVSPGLGLTPDSWQILDTQPLTAPAGTVAALALFGFRKLGAGGQAVFHLDDARLENTDVVGCLSDDTGLCLNGGRFRVTATRRVAGGTDQPAHAVQLTSDTGHLWFFNAANVEAVVKVLDGCGLNSRFWVFAGGLTNVRVDLDVEDLVRGGDKAYVNPQGIAFEPIQDTAAFATCP